MMNFFQVSGLRWTPHELIVKSFLKANQQNRDDLLSMKDGNLTPLDEGKDISVRDLLMHMEKTFGNKHDYDAMIRTLYEVQQRDDEMEDEYMLRIHEVVAVICHMYPECLPDQGWNLKKDCFYHRLCPHLHDALSFPMAELPKREQARPTFDTLYTC